MGMLITESGDQLTTEASDPLQTNEPASVTFDVSTGITIQDITVLSPTSMILDIDIAADAPATARNVTVTTRIGTSDPFVFTVTTSGGLAIPVAMAQYRQRWR